MAMMKELSLNHEECIRSVQKFIYYARPMLDAMEEMAETFQEYPELNQAAESPQVAATQDAAATRVGDEAEPFAETEEKRTASMEEVRGLLAEKARAGFRAEVKALLTAHGAKQLSEITDPVELGALMEEAERLGVGG